MRICDLYGNVCSVNLTNKHGSEFDLSQLYQDIVRNVGGTLSSSSLSKINAKL